MAQENQPIAFDGAGSLDEVDIRAVVGKFDFDLLVIGSGPAGQRAAISAAKHGAKVALVERDPLAGGVCLNTGTIPSKTLREAVLYFTGYRQRGYYGEKYRLKDKISTQDLYDRTNLVIRLERGDINENLESNGVIRLVGTARFLGPNDIEIATGNGTTTVRAAKIIVAVGTVPRRPQDVPFDEVNVFDSDDVFGNSNELRPLPESIIVAGAGVIGIEYSCMFVALGIPTTLIDPRGNPLAFVDDEISKLLYTHLEQNGAKLVFGVKHKAIEILGSPGDENAHVRLTLENNLALEADNLLFALGRVPVVKDLGLEKAGVVTDERGYIKVDETYRTNVPSIYAAGDVIGFPSLASTSAEQGRVAALSALGAPATWHPDLLPYGIYAIPEIGMVGKTEQQLVADNVQYFKGTALFRDTARGKILGDLSGALKLLFSKESRKLLGVHIIGEGATELLHIGQAVMHFGGEPEYFVNTVFNYPTLAEAYKVAAFNAINRLTGRTSHSAPLHEQIYSEITPEDYVKWTPT
ncbi:Si-specific NAD(P)(+) transhydrogenase [Candidatus Sumerlaeota bacterium]|nr:Si-specific NAD(P)(+) transhydrogenase [Candidatus Sumerlaeota bacterium]